MHNNDLWKAERKIVGRLLAPKRLDGELLDILEAEYGVLRMSKVLLTDM